MGSWVESSGLCRSLFVGTSREQVQTPAVSSAPQILWDTCLPWARGCMRRWHQMRYLEQGQGKEGCPCLCQVLEPLVRLPCHSVVLPVGQEEQFPPGRAVPWSPGQQHAYKGSAGRTGVYMAGESFMCPVREAEQGTSQRQVFSTTQPGF